MKKLSYPSSPRCPQSLKKAFLQALSVHKTSEQRPQAQDLGGTAVSGAWVLPQMPTSCPACGRARCTALPGGMEGKYRSTQAAFHRFSCIHMAIQEYRFLHGNHGSSVSARQIHVHSQTKQLANPQHLPKKASRGLSGPPTLFPLQQWEVFPYV